MLRVRNRDLLNTRVKQNLEAPFQVELRIVGYPQHDLPRGVAIQSSRFGQPGGFESLRVLDIGREEQVERRAILDLGEKVAGRAEDQFHVLARFFLKTCRHILKSKLQIGSSSHSDFLRHGHATKECGGGKGETATIDNPLPLASKSIR